MERLKSMKEDLVRCIESQMNHLDTVDTKELGEAIDMVKDLSEAIYYCTVTKAMEESSEEERHYYGGSKRYPYYDDREKEMNEGRMYYRGRSRDSKGRFNYDEPSGNGEGNHYYTERDYPMDFRDHREGRSHEARRMYMEAKTMNKDKTTQMKELERYAQDLTQDIIEMVEDASPEERQYMSKRITALANKLQEAGK